jgi:hypothetical protein
VTLLALLSPVLALLLVVVMQRLELRVLTESAGGPEPEPGSSELRDDTLGEEIELLAGVIATVGGRGRHLTDPEVDQALGLEPEGDGMPEGDGTPEEDAASEGDGAEGDGAEDGQNTV